MIGGPDFEMAAGPRALAAAHRAAERTLLPITRTGNLPFPEHHPDARARRRPTLRLRRGTSADAGALLRMAVRFATETAYRDVVAANVGQLEILIRFLLEHGAVFVAHVDGGDDLAGMIGASVIRHPIGGELVGSEVAWWMEPDYRGSSMSVRLLDAAEAWARDQGALKFQMIAPAGEDALRALYGRRGYVEVETTYQRDLVDPRGKAA